MELDSEVNQARIELEDGLEEMMGMEMDVDLDYWIVGRCRWLDDAVHHFWLSGR